MTGEILALLGLSALFFLATGLQITCRGEDGGPKGPVTGPIAMMVGVLLALPAWIEVAELLGNSELATFAIAVIAMTVWVVFAGVGGLIFGEELRTVIGLDPTHDPELTEVPWDE